MQRGNLETAAANYSYLRGLFAVPAGVLLILAALVNWGVGPLWAFPVAAVVAGAAYLLIARYYRENYGRFRPSARQQVRGAVAVVIGPGQMTDVEEILALDVEEGTLALVSAEVVPLGDDEPGIHDPELAQGSVNLAGLWNEGGAVARL